MLLVRAMGSESDGMRVLYHLLAVLVPALVLVLVGWVVRKRWKRSGRAGGISKMAAGLCGVVGLASGAALWVTVPTEFGIAEKMVEESRDLILGRAGQLAACRDLMESVPVGGLAGQLSAEQFAELEAVEMDFEHSDKELPSEWNALFTVDSDYARLKVDTDPDSIMDPWNRPTPAFYRPSDYRYSYDLKGKVDDIADLAYGDAAQWRSNLEILLAELKQLKYVVIVRKMGWNAPLLTGDRFANGYAEWEAFCFDLGGRRLIGGFVFAATNSEKVSYNYAKNAHVTAQADSAGKALEDDLEKNGWPAFWHRLHEVAKRAKSPYSGEKLPYQGLALAEAMLIMKAKQRVDAERAKAVEEKLRAENLPEKEATGVAPAGDPTAVIQLSAEEDAEIRKLFAEEGLVAAVKRVREITGQGLAWSKAYVEGMEDPK